MINLDKRLSKIYEFLEPCDTLADIGCDHGKLIVKALVDGICKQGLAVDISAPSLSKAVALGDKCGVSDRLVPIVSDGFDNLINYDIDIAVISGMGADEIISILKKSQIKPKQYIFVPHRNEYLLRLYLKNNGFFIIRDIVVEENEKFYNIISAQFIEKCSDYLDDIYLYLGKSNDKNNLDFCHYLDNIYRKLIFIKSKVTNNIDLENINKQLQYIKEARKW